jgi:hypothetical protein
MQGSKGIVIFLSMDVVVEYSGDSDKNVKMLSNS